MSLLHPNSHAESMKAFPPGTPGNVRLVGLSAMGFFSGQRLHGFRQVVTHVQSQQKGELQLSCKAVYLSIATKALVVDLHTVQ